MVVPPEPQLAASEAPVNPRTRGGRWESYFESVCPEPSARRLALLKAITTTAQRHAFDLALGECT